MTTNFFSPLSFVAVFGPGMSKNQDPGILTETVFFSIKGSQIF
jgi:hypothetical protein